MAVQAKKTVSHVAAPAAKSPVVRRSFSSTMGRSAAGSQTKASPRLVMVEEDKAEQTQMQLAQWSLAAIENSRSNTFLCDTDFKIVYANKKSIEVLQVMEPNLRKEEAWKRFTAADVIGMNLDFLFADEPGEFRRATDTRNHPYRQNIHTGPCICDIQVTGIHDANGELTGYSVDWERITDKLALQKKQTQLIAALEGAASNVMISDKDLNVVYMNKSLKRSMKKWEPELQKIYGAGFKTEDLVGRCIDDFHKNPRHQRSMLANESNFPIETKIEVGPLKIDLAVNVIKIGLSLRLRHRRE